MTGTITRPQELNHVTDAQGMRRKERGKAGAADRRHWFRELCPVNASD
jgi:hypothetical protein